eukprot:12907383-Alexandrium_andersonii.AAC.1
MHQPCCIYMNLQATGSRGPRLAPLLGPGVAVPRVPTRGNPCIVVARRLSDRWAGEPRGLQAEQECRSSSGIRSPS